MRQVRMYKMSDPHQHQTLEAWFRDAVLQLIDATGRTTLGPTAVMRAKKMSVGSASCRAHARVSDLAVVAVRSGQLPAVLAVVDELRSRLEAMARHEADHTPAPLALMASVAREVGEALGATAEGVAHLDSAPAVELAIRELSEGIEAKRQALAFFFAQKRRLRSAGTMKPTPARRAAAARRFPATPTPRGAR